MAKTVVEYSCLLISPSDVAEDRAALSDVVEHWNAQVGKALGARVNLERWETHAVPDASEPPQAVINRQVGDECDFGIAVFWARVGSPTTEHQSGSIEEIERLRARGAQVLIYFNSAPIPQSHLQDEQFRRLVEFKTKLRSEGLLGTYDSTAHLREQVILHLTSVVADLLKRDRGQPSPVEGRVVLTAPTPDVRVVVFSGGVLPPIPGLDHILAIRIKNYSPVVVFVSGVSVMLKSGKGLLLFRDAMTGATQTRQELRPGESMTWSCDGDALLREFAIDEFDTVVVADDIGRTYKPIDGALQEILNKWNSHASPSTVGTTGDAE